MNIDAILSFIALFTSFAGIISNYFLLRERIVITEKRTDTLTAQCAQLEAGLARCTTELNEVRTRLTKLEDWGQVDRSAIEEGKADRSELWRVLNEKEEKLLRRMDELLTAINELRVTIASLQICELKKP